MKRNFFFILVVSIGCGRANALVSPVIYQTLILENTIGGSRCVKVAAPTGPGERIRIQTCSEKQGQALRFVLKNSEQYFFSDEAGKEILPLPESSIEKTKTFVKGQLAAALCGNRYVVKVHEGRGFLNGVTVEYARDVIQFWVDNLGDLYGNANYLAQNLFTEVVNENFFGNIQVSATTAPQSGYQDPK